jgi:hypothetical protein
MTQQSTSSRVMDSPHNPHLARNASDQFARDLAMLHLAAPNETARMRKPLSLSRRRPPGSDI